VFLSKIALLNFKNHPALSLNFTKKINCIIGNNGVGKTNLLDAIYYLCLTKSYFNPVDQQNIYFGKDFFRLDGKFEKQNESFEIVYKLPTNKRKELLVNDTPVPKLSEHIGNFPAIIISPDDSQLILGSSEERRRFLDNTISQVNHEYLDRLITYNKLLTQRNAALKRFAETRQVDRPLIETYDQQLGTLGTKIHASRKDVIGRLSPIFQSFYKQLSFEREAVSFTYSSQLNDKPFAELLKANFERDVQLQRTDAGIHKDDIDFFIGKNKLKRFGSQGQQKSFIIAIKFAQYEFIRNPERNPNPGGLRKPLLLIDDIFDKLDNDRSRKLVELIAGEEFGQVFITDTEDAHIREVLKGKEEAFEVFRI
jgi:DNA replication and repair protein RecF